MLQKTKTIIKILKLVWQIIKLFDDVAPQDINF